MRTGMNIKFKRITGRILSFIMILSVLSAYGCNKGKTIDPNFYPTAVENGSETAKETKTEKPQLSDEEILKPENDTFRETGKFEYNPAVIPNWVLEEAKDKPQLVRVAKDALVAINNCDTEFTIDEDLKLTQDDIQALYYIIYYSTPLYGVVLLSETDEKNTYTLDYFPQFVESVDDEGKTSYDVQETDTSEAKETIDAFKDYVTNLINDNLTSDMSEKEMAAIIYRELVKDIKFEPVSSDSYMGMSPEAFNSGEIIKGIFDKKYTGGEEFISLYAFFMAQLHIDIRTVGTASGFYTESLKTTLGDKTPISYFWGWQVIQLDGEYYNCDIVLEKLVYGQKYGEESGVDPDMEFFGMSDKERIKSYKVGKASVFWMDTINPGSASLGNVPNCENDYDYH